MMSSCPESHELERYVHGDCEASVAQRIASHLNGCDRCAALVEGAARDDDLLGELRGAWVHAGAEAGSGVSRGVPDRIARYAIRRVISSGGMGTVYEAEQEEPRRTVAVKVIKPGVVSRSVVARFQRESEVLGRLRHPAVGQIFEAGLHDDGGTPVPYFAMAYVHGARHVTDYVSGESLSIPAIVDLFIDICDGVAHGHEAGVVHRDLKPGNILIDGDGRPRIIDFGIARAIDSDMTAVSMQTAVGEIVGTLHYMAPEQCQADPSRIGKACDVYALGMILHELLTGARPYDVSGVGLHDAIRMIREEEPPPLNRVRPDVPTDLSTIVAKALEKAADRRYADAAALRDDLRRYRAQRPIVARPPSATYRLRLAIRRQRAWWTAAAAVVVVAGAGLGISMLFAGKADRAAAEELIEQGIRLQKMEQYREAAASFERVLDIDPREFRALGNLAILKKDLYIAEPPGAEDATLLTSAIGYADRALEINPGHAGILTVKAVALMLAGDIDGAEGACLAALEADPAYFWSETVLARVLAMDGRLDEALAHARHACGVAVEVHGNGQLTVGQWYTLGTIEHFMGIASAIESLQQAVRCDPKDVGARLPLARLHLDRGPQFDPSMALVHAMVAVDASPRPSESAERRTDPRAERMVAMAYLAMEDFDAAIAHAESAMALGDMPTINLLVVARAAVETGDGNRAREALARATESWPVGLREPGQWRAGVLRGILWFETADELIGLRDGARSALSGEGARTSDDAQVGNGNSG